MKPPMGTCWSRTSLVLMVATRGAHYVLGMKVKQQGALEQKEREKSIVGSGGGTRGNIYTAEIAAAAAEPPPTRATPATRGAKSETEACHYCYTPRPPSKGDHSGLAGRGGNKNGWRMEGTVFISSKDGRRRRRFLEGQTPANPRQVLAVI